MNDILKSNTTEVNNEQPVITEGEAHAKSKQRRKSPTVIDPKEEAIKRDLRLVKGIFKNYESPNSPCKFSKRKYKCENIRTYEMWDGQEYEVPYYVAKQLAEGAWYPRNERFRGEDGKQSIKMGTKIKRVDFIPTNDFVEIDRPSNLVTVQRG